MRSRYFNIRSPWYKIYIVATTAARKKRSVKNCGIFDCLIQISKYSIKFLGRLSE